MFVNIKTADDKVFQIKVDKRRSVHNLKVKIENKVGIAPSNQKLIKDITFLRDNKKISDYLQKDNQTLFLTTVDRSLLLNSSVIFENSTFIDRIHQSIIDLYTINQENEVLNLLIEAFSYLDNDGDLNTETISEIFSLIQSCFYHFPKICSTTLDLLFKKSKINSNYIIITASILSFVNHSNFDISILNFKDFIHDASEQIFNQKDADQLVIFDCQIPSHFKLSFIIDIISLNEITPSIYKNMIDPYILQQQFTTKTNIHYLINDIKKTNVKSLLPKPFTLFKDENELMKVIHDETTFVPKQNKMIPVNNQLIYPNCSVLSVNSYDEQINNLISKILNDPAIENNKKVFQYLFTILMKDKDIARYYFQIQFDKMHKFGHLKPDCIIDKMRNYLRSKNHNVLIDALSQNYVLSPTKNYFMKKHTKVEIIPSKLGLYAISKLFQFDSYQSFVCLKNIASCFPFLFSDYSQQLFNIVFLAFNHFQIVFEISTTVEEKKQSAKIAISALSFLHTVLYSTKILQDFVFCVFENLLSFNEYQIYAVSQILNSLFETEKIKYIVFALSLKYDFITNITKLLSKKISNELFMNYYKSSIYEVLKRYYNTLNEIDKKKSNQNNNKSWVYVGRTNKTEYLPVFIEQTQKVENPFELFFNNKITIIPRQIIPLDVRYNSFTKEFMNKINADQPFWLTNMITSPLIHLTQGYVDQTEVDTLINDFKMKYPNNITLNERLPSPSYYYTTEQARYLFTFPKWIRHFFFYYKSYACIPEHIEEINEIIKEIKSNPDYKKNKTPNNKNKNIDNVILSLYNQKKLYKIIIDDATSFSDQANNTLCKLCENITQNNVALTSFLDLISQYITNEYSQNDLYSSYESIRKLINIIGSISSNPVFKDYFFYQCGNKLIDLLVSPDYRINIAHIANLFDLINCNYSNKINHLVGFMFGTNNSETIFHAIKICSKYDTNNFDNLLSIIKHSFNHEIEKSRQYNNLVKVFIDTFPLLGKGIEDKFYLIISKLINDYNEEPEIGTLEYICTLLNYLAPKRDQKQFFLTQESVDIDYTGSLTDDHQDNFFPFSDDHISIIRPAPEILIEKSPKFWNFYNKNISFISGIIQNDETLLTKFTFLNDYFELIDFRIRATSFRKNMRNMMKGEYGTNYLTVRRDNVLSDSFESLRSSAHFHKKFLIHFEGENGIDAGGLTEDWFTLIVQELFNPNYNLFKQLKNNGFQPSDFSYLNGENYIEYFEFAGKIIAAAIIGEHYVKAHLSMAFCRQIMHRKPKFKDLEDYDDKLYESLQWLLDNDVDPLEMTFTIDINEFGQNKTIELKENGENILVTNENKLEYVTLYTWYHLRKSIKKQIDAFCEGFNSIIPHEDIRMFSPSELDLLICGIPTIDINDLKENTAYCLPYHDKHPVILLFFKTISKWDNENLAKFMLFLTGSSQVPIGGFKIFKDRGCPITIIPGGDETRFPSSHTCFNQLALPVYKNEFDMNNKLLRAIQEREFGFA